MKPYTVEYPAGFTKPVLPGKAEWVKALRSGEYKQGRSCLMDEDGCYCCLGVLSKVQGRLNSYGVDGGTGYGGSSVTLSHDNPLRKWLKQAGGFPNGGHVQGVDSNGDERPYNELAAMNDNGYTFEQIADVIDAFWD